MEHVLDCVKFGCINTDRTDVSYTLPALHIMLNRTQRSCPDQSTSVRLQEVAVLHVWRHTGRKKKEEIRIFFYFLHVLAVNLLHCCAGLNIWHANML